MSLFTNRPPEKATAQCYAAIKGYSAWYLTSILQNVQPKKRLSCFYVAVFFFVVVAVFSHADSPLVWKQSRHMELWWGVGFTEQTICRGFRYFPLSNSRRASLSRVQGAGPRCSDGSANKQQQNGGWERKKWRTKKMFSITEFTPGCWSCCPSSIPLTLWFSIKAWLVQVWN